MAARSSPSLPPDTPSPLIPEGLAEPDYIGHRDRLRTRFLSAGPEALADYELLELLLYAAIPRRDTKPVAKALIARFGSFAGVIGAEPAALREIKYVGDGAVALLKVVQTGIHRVLRAESRDRTVLDNWTSVLDYCRASMGYEPIEQFRLLFLDRKNAIIADEVQQRGTVDHTPVYPREVVKRALELNASAIIMVHNHPSGDPKPSRADIEMTREVIKAAASLGIQLHDHVVIGRTQHYSMKSMGVI
jgi:DNA repair protein RadC